MQNDRFRQGQTGRPVPFRLPPVSAGAAVRAEPGARHNLPYRLTSFVGRERELAELKRLARTCRLLTLTGPGGSGKTRLALEFAASLASTYTHGVHVVSLAPIVDPRLAMPTIAEVIGVREGADEPLAKTIARSIGQREMLLVLDNFEHLVSAGPAITDLLAACPQLMVIVTSRELLRLYGEQAFPVPPLTVPEYAAAPSKGEDVASHVAATEAGRLFVERARSVQPDFRLDPASAPAVAEICARLDGLPLAIELAAARVRLLSPRAMAERLENRLPLLTGGPRDLPLRQRTLYATIAWSYDLLDELERRLFRRLAVFAGGCSLEAAEAVYADEGSPSGESAPLHDRDILNVISSLVDKSLLLRQGAPDGKPRLTMLETIREFGYGQLEANREAGAACRAHATFFLRLVEDGEKEPLGTGRSESLRRIEAEYHNLRAILERSRDGKVAADVGLRLAGLLGEFWDIRGIIREGLGWSRAMLAIPEAPSRTAARARVLYIAATLAVRQADYRAARALAQESAAIFKEVGDLQGIARALIREAASELHAGNLARARPLLEESVVLARKVSDRQGLAEALGQLAGAAFYARDCVSAGALLSEVAAIAQELEDSNLLGIALTGLALVARLCGSSGESVALYKQALLVSTDFQDYRITLRALAGLAGAACLAGDHTSAARLFGAVEALHEAGGTREIPRMQTTMMSDIAAAQAGLGDDAFAVAWTDGRAMNLEQACRLAIELAATPRSATLSIDGVGGPPDSDVGSLTRREREVARLIAEGLTNRQIAEELVIAVRTAHAHVGNILGKLGFSSRSQIAVWALEHGLLPRPAPGSAYRPPPARGMPPEGR